MRWRGLAASQMTPLPQIRQITLTFQEIPSSLKAIHRTTTNLKQMALKIMQGTFKASVQL
jgi:hypothetical protein